jgi:hypothetical protein
MPAVPVAEGIADPRRIASSASRMAGPRRSRERSSSLTCTGVRSRLCGPLDVATCIAPYLGDQDDPAEGELHANASPLFAADRINIPMLIAQGANDPRVIQLESEQIVGRLNRTAGTRRMFYVVAKVYGLVRPSNNLDFTARAERFLAGHLVGRCEPRKERMPDSTAIVEVIGN